LSVTLALPDDITHLAVPDIEEPETLPECWPEMLPRRKVTSRPET
jgi:hypothetical protein